MTSFAIFIQEGFGTNGESIYFTNEPPTFEAEQIPVFAVIANGEKIQVGEREETFMNFIPLNGPYRMRGKSNRIPFHRVLSVVEQGNENSEEEEQSDV